MRLGCGHVYHRQCLERWLIEWRGEHCPTCRAPVLPRAMATAATAAAAAAAAAGTTDSDAADG
jgi:hypothetical protein